MFIVFKDKRIFTEDFDLRLVFVADLEVQDYYVHIDTQNKKHDIRNVDPEILVQNVLSYLKERM